MHTIMLLLASLSSAALAQAGASRAAWDLGALVAAAQARSPAVVSAGLALRALREQRGQAAAYDNPVLSFLHDTDDAATLTQRVEFPSKRGSRLKVLDLQLDEAQSELEIARSEAAAAAKTAYFSCLLALRRRELVKSDLESFDRLRVQTPQRYQAGLKNQLGALRMDVEAARGRSALAQAEQDAEEARQRLRNLAGLAPDDPLELGGRLDDTPPLPELPVLQSRLQDSPYRRRLAALAGARGAMSELERRSRLPDLDLTLDRVSRSGGERSTGAGLGLALPLWSRRSAAIRGAEALEAQARAELEAQARESDGALRAAYRRHRTSSQIVADYRERLLDRARSAQATALLSYEQGLVPLTDYLDTIRTVRDAQLEYQQALYDLQAARAEIDRLLGD